MSNFATNTLTPGVAFVPPHTGKPVFVCVLIENSQAMSFRWNDLQNYYLPALFYRMRAMNQGVNIKIWYKTSSPVPLNFDASQRQFNEMPPVAFVQDPTNRISVGSLYHSALLLAKSGGAKDPRHLFALAIGSPSDAVELSQQVRDSATPEIYRELVDLHELEPAGRWQRLRDLLYSANIRFHMILDPHTDARLLVSIFDDVVRLEDCVQVPPWFQVKHDFFTFFLAGERAELSPATSPASEHAPGSAHHAPLPPAPADQPLSADYPDPPFAHPGLPRGPIAPLPLYTRTLGRPRINSLSLARGGPSASSPSTSSPLAPSPHSAAIPPLAPSSTPPPSIPAPTQPKDTLVAQLQSAHGLSKRRHSSAREPLIRPPSRSSRGEPDARRTTSVASAGVLKKPKAPTALALPIPPPGHEPLAAETPVTPTAVSSAPAAAAGFATEPSRWTREDGFAGSRTPAGEKPFIFYPEYENVVNAPIGVGPYSARGAPQANGPVQAGPGPSTNGHGGMMRAPGEAMSPMRASPPQSHPQQSRLSPPKMTKASPPTHSPPKMARVSPVPAHQHQYQHQQPQQQHTSLSAPGATMHPLPGPGLTVQAVPGQAMQVAPGSGPGASPPGAMMSPSAAMAPPPTPSSMMSSPSSVMSSPPVSTPMMQSPALYPPPSMLSSPASSSMMQSSPSPMMQSPPESAPMMQSPTPPQTMHVAAPPGPPPFYPVQRAPGYHHTENPPPPSAPPYAHQHQHQLPHPAQDQSAHAEGRYGESSYAEPLHGSYADSASAGYPHSHSTPAPVPSAAPGTFADPTHVPPPPPPSQAPYVDGPPYQTDSYAYAPSPTGAAYPDFPMYHPPPTTVEGEGQWYAAGEHAHTHAYSAGAGYASHGGAYGAPVQGYAWGAAAY